jgi:hypothetical protein
MSPNPFLHSSDFPLLVCPIPFSHTLNTRAYSSLTLLPFTSWGLTVTSPLFWCLDLTFAETSLPVRPGQSQSLSLDGSSLYSAERTKSAILGNGSGISSCCAPLGAVRGQLGEGSYRLRKGRRLGSPGVPETLRPLPESGGSLPK